MRSMIVMTTVTAAVSPTVTTAVATSMTAAVTVGGISTNRALHIVDHARQRAQQGMDVMSVAVHVTVASAVSGIDHLVHVMRQFIDLLEIAQNVAERSEVVMRQFVQMIGFAFDRYRVVDQMAVDRGMVVVLTKFAAQFAYD